MPVDGRLCHSGALPGPGMPRFSRNPAGWSKAMPMAERFPVTEGGGHPGAYAIFAKAERIAENFSGNGVVGQGGERHGTPGRRDNSRGAATRGAPSGGRCTAPSGRVDSCRAAESFRYGEFTPGSSRVPAGAGGLLAATQTTGHLQLEGRNLMVVICWWRFGSRPAVYPRGLGHNSKSRGVCPEGCNLVLL